MSSHDHDTHDTGEDHGGHHGPLSVSPVWVRRILTFFWVGCAILFALDFAIERKTEHRWEELPGFYAIFGFGAIYVLIAVSKELRKGVGRSEDYYDA